MTALETCGVCGKPAEGKGELCNCVCPQCGVEVFDDPCIPDHGMCWDCHKKWQYGELVEQE